MKNPNPDYRHFNKKKLILADNPHTENENFNRDQYDILLQAKTAWEDIAHYRERRNRNRDYTFGKQWGDKITLPDGRTMTEDEYLKEQGKVPLKNNLLRKMVKNVVGQFRGTQTEPVCIARDRNEQGLSELMSTAIQYAYQHNQIWEIDGRSIEEFLISGTCFHKIGYGWRNGKMDVWIDFINPNRIFFNTMEDIRHWDCSLIGELHDVSIAEVIGKFAKGSRKKAAELREIYSNATHERLTRNFENLTSRTFDNMDFLIPKDTHLCRVIEVWKLENKERLRCHDILSGEYFLEELETLPQIEKENEKRIEQARIAGLTEEETALIEIEWFIDQFWYYRFFSPFGDILDEGETPYWHEEHPYCFKLYPFIDGEIHSFVEDIIDQQRYVNRLITMTDFIIGASAKGVLLYPEDMIPDGLTIEDVAQEWSRYNGVLLYKPKPGYPQPQQINSSNSSSGVSALLGIQISMMEDISGVHEAMQGKRAPSGTPASLYLQETQNAAQNLIDIFESFKSFRENRDTKMMKIIQQYYNESRYLTIAGNKISADAMRYFPEKVKNAEFDLNITESTSSPAYRTTTNQFLLELFKMGQINLEMLLQNGSFPFSDQLLQSISQNKAEAEAEAKQKIQELAQASQTLNQSQQPGMPQNNMQPPVVPNIYPGQQ